MGFCKDLYNIYPSLNCLILPSLHEGLSYTAIEACAFYCPVIANNIPGIKEIIHNKKNGFLIEEPSLENYAKKITEMHDGLHKNIPDKDFCDSELRKYDRKNFMASYKKFLKEKLSN